MCAWNVQNFLLLQLPMTMAPMLVIVSRWWLDTVVVGHCDTENIVEKLRVLVSQFSSGPAEPALAMTPFFSIFLSYSALQSFSFSESRETTRKETTIPALGKARHVARQRLTVSCVQAAWGSHTNLPHSVGWWIVSSPLFHSSQVFFRFVFGFRRMFGSKNLHPG